ncbi:MAG: cell cycle response regulator DivK [Spirochaetes bacterium GWB1_59_5]|nr:MAG: cell cycle response regulator DivK [Spirochaetes bacterium GWB1_59_5]
MEKSALVIDDNANNLLLEKDLLEVAGFVVYTAENATIGISLAREKLPGIIIMDMRLPDMRGSDAARILLQYPETCNIPVVFVTASVLAEGIEEIKTIPNAVFISKPVNTRTFAKEVTQFMK